MSDSIELPNGTFVPIQDTVCECGHWHEEHESGMVCEAFGCECLSFLADPEARRKILLHALRDRVVGEGCPVDSCEVSGAELEVEFAGSRFYISISREVRR